MAGTSKSSSGHGMCVHRAAVSSENLESHPSEAVAPSRVTEPPLEQMGTGSAPRVNSWLSVLPQQRIDFPRSAGPILASGKLSPVKINSHLDATIGGACERLHDGPVGQHIGRHVDFVLGAIDQCNVDMFEVFDRRVVNCRRGIGGAWCRKVRKRTAVRETRNWLNAIAFNFWLARAIEPNEAAAPLWAFGEP